MSFKTTLFCKNGQALECLLCPNRCSLKKEGQFGVCRIRKREGDVIVNPYSGVLSSQSIDPVEKKPLYHFKPGSDIFSVGFYGCTLQCGFCQNHSISQHRPSDLEGGVTPGQIVDFLIKKKIPSIAFTYSEPCLYAEWVTETARLCRKEHIKTVLVTNGYLNAEPASELLEVIDGANIDLKSSEDSFYRSICKGKVENVKEFIRIAYEKKVHIEVTTLVITGSNDSLDECSKICNFIASLSPDIPYHISRYHPCYKFTKPPTPEKTIRAWCEQARTKLHYVYAGNVGFDNDTLCKKCGAVLVERKYYMTSVTGLSTNGKCSSCGEDNNFVSF